MKIQKNHNGFNKKKKLGFLYNFIKDRKLAVLATVSKSGFPESSVMGIAITKELEIICSSFNSSRKFQNLKANSKASLVIGWEKGKTVQYEGVAKEVLEKDLDDVLELYLKRVFSIAKYVPREFGVIYKIKPKWIRYSDLGVEPWERFDVKF